MRNASGSIQVDSLIAQLREADLSSSVVLPSGFLEDLRTLLGADAACAYRPMRTAEGIAAEFVDASGTGARRARFTGMLRELVVAPPIMPVYDPLAVEHEQRNRVVRVSSWERTLRFSVLEMKGLGRSVDLDAPSADMTRIAIERMHPHIRSESLEHLEQIRVLVTDGARLLAWVGAFKEGGFGPRHAALFGRLNGALRERLKLKLEVRTGGLAAASLEAALAAIPRPAAIVDRQVRVYWANEAGIRLFDGDRQAFASRVRAAIAGAASHDRAWPLGVEARGHYLVQFEVNRTEAQGEKREALRQTWRLTARQGEVLDGVCEGLSNKEIAARLGLSLGTVELHVHGLLAKVGLPSRARLIAAAAAER